MYTFQVVGRPVPQGSMRHVGGGRLVSKTKKLSEWRAAIAQAVTSAVGDIHYTGPVRVIAHFTFKPPKSVTRRHVTVAPDLDKLQRALGDALSIDCKFLADDAQITEWVATKHYGIEDKLTFIVELL